jgi:hypothetical protein
MNRLFRSNLIRIVLGAALLALASGCATNRKPVQLPYTFPTRATASPDAPAAEIANVTDTREDRSLDMFLSERTPDFLRKAFAAEFEAAGTFARVAITSGAATGPAPLVIDLALKDVSWAVPNHEKMVKTAFWTSLLTGGLGGLAYGSTDTPVFGHAALVVKVTERSSGRVLFNETVETLHEEKMAKLKSDTLGARSQVMAAALKGTLVKAAGAVRKSRETGAAATPAPATSGAAP